MVEHSKPTFAERYRNDVLLRAGLLLERIDQIFVTLSHPLAGLSSEGRISFEAELQKNLRELGLSTYSDILDFRYYYRQRLDERTEFPITPLNFPSLEEFADSYERVLQCIAADSVFSVADKPVASQVAILGVSSWERLSYPRAIKGPVDYLYGLGRVMSDPVVYNNIVEIGDEIRIISGWRIANGLHRSLSLKVLGPTYVSESGLDEWVKVRSSVINPASIA